MGEKKKSFTLFFLIVMIVIVMIVMKLKYIVKNILLKITFNNFLFFFFNIIHDWL